MNHAAFFESIISAGAVLSGFCGTFLAFKIQREASYYRQPVLDFDRAESKDVFIGLSHFSSAFLLLITGTFCSVIFGFVLPLFALAGSVWILSNPAIVVAGMMSALIVIGAYFLAELVHFGVLNGRLLNDRREWGSESGIVIGGITSAAIGAVVAYLLIGTL